MSEQLQRHLRAVVKTRFEGKARRASKAAGLNPDAIWRILENENHMPDLRTLKVLAEAFDWPLGDVVRWALGEEGEEGDIPPMQEVERGLRRLGLPTQLRDGVMTLIRGLPSDG